MSADERPILEELDRIDARRIRWGEVVLAIVIGLLAAAVVSW